MGLDNERQTKGHILTQAYTVLTHTADLAGVLLVDDILLADGQHMELHNTEEFTKSKPQIRALHKRIKHQYVRGVVVGCLNMLGSSVVEYFRLNRINDIIHLHQQMGLSEARRTNVRTVCLQYKEQYGKAAMQRSVKV